jgi:hypothetical protein
MHTSVLQKENCPNISSVQIQDNPSGLDTSILVSATFCEPKILKVNTTQHNTTNCQLFILQNNGSIFRTH